MKKSMIAAGAASVALAAMPIVGAFAVGHNGTLTDIIQTTVGETCSFTRDETESTPGDPSTSDLGHTSGTWTRDGSNDTIDTLSAVSIAALNTEQAIGNSKFSVACNDTEGYQVAITTHSDLEIPGDNVGDPKKNTHVWSYAAATPASPTASYWRIDVTGAEGTDLSTNIVSTKSSAQDGKDFTVTYKAYAVTEQDAGTYKGTAVYTFTQL